MEESSIGCVLMLFSYMRVCQRVPSAHPGAYNTRGYGKGIVDFHSGTNQVKEQRATVEPQEGHTPKATHMDSI